jgi:hypothetical protein
MLKMNIKKSSLLSALLPLILTAQAEATDWGELLKQQLEAQQPVVAQSQPASAPAVAASAPAVAASAPAVAAPATTSTASNSTANLSMFSNQDQVSSLKQALTQGAQTAVKSLAKENGFLGNDKVRIPLPESLNKADAKLRQFGMGQYADDLITSMNRAAEAAAPEAQALFLGAIKKMTVMDAKNIILGNQDAATQYFRTNTEIALAGKFQPIVERSMKKVKFTDKYNRFANTGAQLGLIDPGVANLNDYITRKAMDGMFLMMAEQEKVIRANPLEATGNLAKKVFSALKF